jgi:ER-bound oxygenase mpaB/B'/Rubber oxygenase, catalytic domain
VTTPTEPAPMQPSSTAPEASRSPAPGSLPTLLDEQRLAEVNATYRRIALNDFPVEVRTAFHLSYLRTLASPRIAGLLAHTGHIEHQSLRRGYDTSLFTYELIHAGLGSPVGDEVVRRLNDMHHRWRIRNEDYLWVLATFIVPAIRFIDRHGWRRLSEHERQASIDFYRELGTRMDIQDIPTTADSFDAWMSDYEAHELHRTPVGDRLVAATMDTVVSPMPTAVRPLARRAISVLIDEPARSALGFARPHPAMTGAVHAALAVGNIRRRRRPSVDSWFTPGRVNTVYPSGYTLDDLGPREERLTSPDRSASRAAE